MTTSTPASLLELATHKYNARIGSAPAFGGRYPNADGAFSVTMDSSHGPVRRLAIRQGRFVVIVTGPVPSRTPLIMELVDTSTATPLFTIEALPAGVQIHRNGSTQATNPASIPADLLVKANLVLTSV